MIYNLNGFFLHKVQLKSNFKIQLQINGGQAIWEKLRKKMTQSSVCALTSGHNYEDNDKG